jgi:hypothetical protein
VCSVARGQNLILSLQKSWRTWRTSLPLERGPVLVLTVEMKEQRVL